jgi:penicillin-binding protein 1A
LFLSPKKTYTRKIKEILLALEIERRYTKEEILERYLNKIYFGHGVYGVEAASLLYFNKSVRHLILPECVVLASLPKAPNQYSPLINLSATKKRALLVLRRMTQLGYITPEEAVLAKRELISWKPKRDTKEKGGGASYFVEYIRQKLEQTFGSDYVYRGGLKVYTTVDLRMQEAAEMALGEGLRKLNTTSKSQKIEGALIAIDPRNGFIKAMVGGSGFTKTNQINRAIQARRQPGSAFKPFLYVAAIDNGFTPTTTIVDSPVCFRCGGEDWIPQNYDGKYHGQVSLREALERSINVASVKLMSWVKPERVVEYAQRMGIESRLAPNLSLALGTSEVTPIELTRAYGVFANQGIKTKPMAIRYIEDRVGNIILRNKPCREAVLTPETSFILTYLMQGVVKRGTARTIGRKTSWPIAGKTGTTNKYIDAWFVGFTPTLVATVWIGYDKGRIPIGEKATGGAIAAPIWFDFIKEALEEPPHPFPVPKGIIFCNIDPTTGCLATRWCPKIIKEAFIKNTEPTSYCTQHPPKKFF